MVLVFWAGVDVDGPDAMVEFSACCGCNVWIHWDFYFLSTDLCFLRSATCTLQVKVSACSTPASWKCTVKGCRNVLCSFNVSCGMTAGSLENVRGGACTFAWHESQVSLYIPVECWPSLSSPMLISWWTKSSFAWSERSFIDTSISLTCLFAHSPHTLHKEFTFSQCSDCVEILSRRLHHEGIWATHTSCIKHVLDNKRLICLVNKAQLLTAHRFANTFHPMSMKKMC